MRQIKVGTAWSLGITPTDIQCFYRNNWNRQIALSNPTFYSWQFVSAASGDGRDECVVTIVDDVLCGVMGVNSRSFFLSGNRLNGAELTTWIVSREMRGKGSGPVMLNFLVEKYDILIGMGISRDALSLYLRFGFKYLKFIPRYLRIFDLDAILQYSVIDALGLKLARMRSAKRPNKLFKASKLDDQTLDDIFYSFARRYNLFDRSSHAFRWRYSNHPFYKYESHLISDPTATANAVVVTRHQDLPNGQKILRVMDIFGDDEALNHAIGFVDAYCVENHYALADFFCTTTRITGRLVANGWFSVLDEDFFQFPHLFEPIDMRSPPTTSLIYWAKHGLETLADYSNLYITKQDADLDRPVYIGG